MDHIITFSQMKLLVKKHGKNKNNFEQSKQKALNDMLAIINGNYENLLRRESSAINTVEPLKVLKNLIKFMQEQLNNNRPQEIDYNKFVNNAEIGSTDFYHIVGILNIICTHRNTYCNKDTKINWFGNINYTNSAKQCLDAIDSRIMILNNAVTDKTNNSFQQQRKKSTILNNSILRISNITNSYYPSFHNNTTNSYYPSFTDSAPDPELDYPYLDS